METEFFYNFLYFLLSSTAVYFILRLQTHSLYNS